MLFERNAFRIRNFNDAKKMAICKVCEVVSAAVDFIESKPIVIALAIGSNPETVSVKTDTSFTRKNVSDAGENHAGEKAWL